MGNDLGFSIGKFSKKTGVSIRTLHYYDEIGLLNAQKDLSSGHRLYGEDHIVKLQKILALKFLGYNLRILMLTNTSLNLNLQETLIQQQKAFEKKDEIKHYQTFSTIYANLTGKQFEASVAEQCPNTYKEGLQVAIEDEQETVDFYLDISDKAQDLYIKEAFRRAAADEQNHAV